MVPHVFTMNFPHYICWYHREVVKIKGFTKKGVYFLLICNLNLQRFSNSKLMRQKNLLLLRKKILIVNYLSIIYKERITYV